LLDAMEECCRTFRPYARVRAELVREPSTDIFKGVAGAYGKVTGSPHVLLFIADEREPFAAQHVGLTGEAAVLEATRLDLDTCWVGGFFSADKARRLVSLDDGERVYAVSPLGSANPSKSFTEKTMSRLAGSKKRKCVAELAPGISDSWPTWAIAAVETARLAPSALNHQPWRFRLAGQGLAIFTDSASESPRNAKRLDCGIAMLHAQLGASASGFRGSWTDLTGSDVARFDAEAAS